jgi:hypothetical protein
LLSFSVLAAGEEEVSRVEEAASDSPAAPAPWAGAPPRTREEEEEVAAAAVPAAPRTVKRAMDKTFIVICCYY